jgi:dihydrofolate reductase
MIALIVAQSNNRVIGKSNDLPWYLPADLKHFKEVTTGHTVIMGRKTYESIYNRLKGPLPNRRNIVISRGLKQIPEGFELYDSLESAIMAAKSDSEVYIIGGATIYDVCLEQDMVDTIYLTQVHADIEGDTLFQELDISVWDETSREDHKADDKNPYDYSFITLEHKK